MHHTMARQADMNKENALAANIQVPTLRITRARAKALGISGALPLLHPLVKQESNQALLPNTKRGSSDNKCTTDVGSSFQSKRRVVLKDVTNKPFYDLNMKVVNEIKIQTSKQVRRTTKKNDMVAPAVCVDPQDQKGKAKATEDMTKQRIKELREITSQLKLVNDLENKPSIYISPKAGGMSMLMPGKSTSNNQSGLGSSLPKAEVEAFSGLYANSAARHHKGNAWYSY